MTAVPLPAKTASNAAVNRAVHAPAQVVDLRARRPRILDHPTATAHVGHALIDRALTDRPIGTGDRCVGEA
ncbi:hypothetical protein [Streptomyces sp. RTd22]|uniref:hypothetical protein n=1 Tax=Streptomyces sp. RTd22 TaxID=1841249 RepID=UPI000ABF04CE|nr:hypothetical protein [Streptomyces sp. RTd22]